MSEVPSSWTLEGCLTASGLHTNCSNSSPQPTEPVETGQDPGQSLEFRIIKIFLYCIILLCSSLGNGLVVYIVAGNARMRTPSNYLILNLAVCDFITPLLSITFDFVLEEHNYRWIYGAFMCKTLWPATTLSATASALTLAAISLDRYRMIMHPFKPRLTGRIIKVIIASIYLIALILVTPYSYVLSLDDVECHENWPDISYKKFYTLGLCLMQYCLPLMFMVVMYTLALKNLYTTSDKTAMVKTDTLQVPQCRSPSKLRVPSRDENVPSTVLLARKISSAVRGGKTEANVKATKMFIAIVVVFAVCMFPNQALWLWADFGGGSDNPSFPMAAIVCWLFTYTNSVCNAAIYAFFSRDFRRGFKRAFKKLCCCVNSKVLKDFKSLHCGSMKTEVETVADHDAGRKRKKIQFV